MKWKKFAGLLLAVVLAANSGCAALKSDEAAIKADLHTGFLIVSGIAHSAAAAASTPAGQAILAEAKPVVTNLLQKEGVPAATATKLTSALNANDANALAAASDEGAALTATAPVTSAAP